MFAVTPKNSFKGFKFLMIKITKPLLQKAIIAGFFSTLTIGVLTLLTYKSTLGYFLAGSFGSSMVLLFGFPESPFAQPKNVFFGHLLTAGCWGIFCKLYFVTYLYQYFTRSWFWSFFNDITKCCPSSSRW